MVSGAEPSCLPAEALAWAGPAVPSLSRFTRPDRVLACLKTRGTGPQKMLRCGNHSSVSPAISMRRCGKNPIQPVNRYQTVFLLTP